MLLGAYDIAQGSGCMWCYWCAGVVTPHKTFHADIVVLAAALGIPELAKPLGLSVPLTAKPRTVTVITQPLKPILKHIVVNGTHSVPVLCWRMLVIVFHAVWLTSVHLYCGSCVQPIFHVARSRVLDSWSSSTAQEYCGSLAYVYTACFTHSVASKLKSADAA